MNLSNETNVRFWFPNGAILDLRARPSQERMTRTTTREKPLTAKRPPLRNAAPASASRQAVDRPTLRPQASARNVSLKAQRAEERHRAALGLLFALLIAIIILLALYGGHYYLLGASARPFCARHPLLKPSGLVGMNAGLLGTLMFCGIFLYPLRKRLPWLRTRGNSRHWLEYHAVLGMAAPFFIVFHSSFKFRGLAGIAFWMMVLVSISGFIGLYLYGQIPRHVVSAESALRASRAVQAQVLSAAGSQRQTVQSAIQALFELPTPERAGEWPFPVAVAEMIKLDLARPFRIAGLRRAVTGKRQNSMTGFAPTSHAPLERVIALAREQAVLCKQIVFLSRAQKLFQWWHVIHRPLSYGFAVLALLHIAVAMVIGLV